MDVVLLGFAYGHPSTEIPLPSTAIDLALLVDWVQSWLPEDGRLTILSDLPRGQLPLDVRAYSVRSHSELIGALQPYHRQLLVYYSGHGYADGLGLPDGTRLSYSLFNQVVLSFCTPDTEVCYLLDCCFAAAMNLNYELENNNFRLRTHGTRDYHRQNILLLTASEPNFTANSTAQGSCFTVLFLDYVIRLGCDGLRNLEYFRQYLNRAFVQAHSDHYQRIGVYAAGPILPVLPLWLGRNDTSALCSEAEVETYLSHDSQELTHRWQTLLVNVEEL